MATQATTKDSEMLFFSFYNARPLDQRISQRISSDQIAALKQAQRKGQQASSSGPVIVSLLFRNLIEAVRDSMYKPVKKHAMCENYGHIADVAAWTEHLPNCSDCGATIAARNQLRKSSLR